MTQNNCLSQDSLPAVTTPLEKFWFSVSKTSQIGVYFLTIGCFRQELTEIPERPDRVHKLDDVAHIGMYQSSSLHVVTELIGAKCQHTDATAHLTHIYQLGPNLQAKL